MLETQNGLQLDTFAPATAMLAALRKKQLSAVELLDLHLRQIERYNPQINAIVSTDFENARQQATAADAARSRGEDAPLLGLPLTIKDCIYVQNLPSTAGVIAFKDFRPEADSKLVERVRGAGAVIFAKTNIPPFAGDWQADNPIFGRTNNPWDLERTPGGSTGGGAAALASGMTPLEYGSDIGGSIRVPAAFCGVYGHRPSETALARSGHLPGSALPNPATIMGVQGPLARSAADLELAFDVAAGADAGEDVAWRLEIPPARHENLANYRVALLIPPSWLPVDNEIMAAREQLAGFLSQRGAKVEEVALEGLGDLHEYYILYHLILQVQLSLGMSAEKRQELANNLRAANADFAKADGYTASANDYVMWLGKREQYRAFFRGFFRNWDVLLAPITIIPAFRHTTIPFGERTIEVNGQTVKYGDQIFYPSLATLVGHPATAFPVGITKSGLPIGLQAIAPYLEDRTSLRFAGLLEREFGGFQRPPGY